MGRYRSILSEYTSVATASTMRSDGTEKSLHEVFKNKTIEDGMNPKNIKKRESRDSEVNPNSRPIIIGLDVSGSMGFIAENIAKRDLGPIMHEIVETQVVADPHLAFLAIGDAAARDVAPLQATQFESDTSIAQALQEIFIEGRGGSNDSESYTLAWYFANEKVEFDAWDKRKVKGYLFTIGDEKIPPDLTSNELKKTFGNQYISQEHEVLDTKKLYEDVSKKWEIFHIVIEEGNFARRRLPDVLKSWRDVIGNRTLSLNNYKNLKDLIISAMRVNEGEDPETVIESLSANVQESIRRALYGTSIQT